MSDFSLTHPTPRNGRDPHVFAPQPGRDYAMVAEMAWVETQHRALDVLEADGDIRAVSQRLQTAVAWFREHGPTNPQYTIAKSLQGDLDMRLESLMLTLRVVSQACWFQCCVVYAALQHLADRAGWLRDVAGDRFDGTSPQGVWQAVLPGRQPAGSWPIESTGFIERRLSYVEVWNMDELSTLLAQRQVVSA